MTVQSGRAEIALRIAGLSGGGDAVRFAVMDIAAVQDAFAFHGRLTRIDLRLAPGVDAARLQQRLQALLPPGLVVAPPAASTTATARLSRAYRVNLNVLALVALFTGSMLVFATQTLAMARRRPQFALLRTLGSRSGGGPVGHRARRRCSASRAPSPESRRPRARVVRAARSSVPTSVPASFAGAPSRWRSSHGRCSAFGALGILAAIAGSARRRAKRRCAEPAAALKASDAERLDRARAVARLAAHVDGRGHGVPAGRAAACRCSAISRSR